KMDHSKMDHSKMDHSEIPAATLEPRTPIPVITQADRMGAIPPDHPHPVHDNGIFRYVLLNRLEAWDTDEGTAVKWEGQAWIGTDLDRVWLRSEGERSDGSLERADLEVLYGRSVTSWWDVVAGLRHDFAPGKSQDFLALGVMGLAPYMFEVEATAYLGQSGRSELRVETEYEMLLTNRLILQPLVEVNVFGKSDPGRGTGSGLGTVEAGLRLRYEIDRRFAPYIGVVRERAFGRTAELRRDAGRHVDDTHVVAGFRIWF
ncbi:MAG: copper resistance protein B, partial [Pseudomonadota bacterium]|nr:copper resistance protein B [Pseudomonadota bacterium]